MLSRRYKLQILAKSKCLGISLRWQLCLGLHLKDSAVIKAVIYQDEGRALYPRHGIVRRNCRTNYFRTLTLQLQD